MEWNDYYGNELKQIQVNAFKSFGYQHKFVRSVIFCSFFCGIWNQSVSMDFAVMHHGFWEMRTSENK